MSYHRYIVSIEVTVAVPNAPSEPGLPADDELTNSITAAVDKALVGKVKGKRQGRDYTVEKVQKA